MFGRRASAIVVLLSVTFTVQAFEFAYHAYWPQLRYPWYGLQPNRLASDAEGNVYALSEAQFRKLAPDGEILAEWPMYDLGLRFVSPSDFALGRNGEVFAVSHSDPGIHVFDALTGVRLRKFADEEDEPGYVAGASDIGTDADGYVIAWTEDAIVVFDSDETFVASWNPSASGHEIHIYNRSCAFGPDGSVYIPAKDEDGILRFSRTGAFIQRIAELGLGTGQLNAIADVAIGPDGLLAVTQHYGVARVSLFTADTGIFVSELPTWCTTAVTAPGGLVYLSSREPAGVEVRNHSGALIDSWRTIGPEDGLFQDIKNVAMDVYGNVYATDAKTLDIQKFDRDGRFVKRWSAQVPEYRRTGRFLRGLAASRVRERLYVATAEDQIRVFDLDGNLVETWSYTDSPFRIVEDIYIAPDEDVYLLVTREGYSEGGRHQVERYTPDGTPVSIASLVSLPIYSFAHGLAVDDNGRLYVAGNSVYRFTRDGALDWITSLAGVSGLAVTDWGPRDLEFGPDGFLYVSDISNDALWSFDKDGIYGNHFFRDLTIPESKGGKWLVSEVPGSLHAFDFALDPAGNFAVCDQTNERVAVFRNIRRNLLDPSGDNRTDAVDIQRVVNAALGVNRGILADINEDGAWDAVDIQRIVNAVLGV